MILQALKSYYDRKAEDPESGIAPLGWERKELPFLIVINSDGTPVNIEDTREYIGKRLCAKAFMVPQAVKRARGMKSNLLWDDPEYALAMDIKRNPERASEKNKLFVKRIQDDGLSDIPDVAAVLRFLNSPDFKNALFRTAPEKYEELKGASFVSFKIAGKSEPVFRNHEVVERLTKGGDDEGPSKSLCIVSGIKDVIDPTHPAIKGVRDANTTGGNIVSFNAAAFCSYGKQQGANAPIGKAASFAYTTALNTLLGKDSRQKLQVGDSTAVFWSERNSFLEKEFCDFFAEPPKDNPDQLTESVASLYNSIDTGVFTKENDDTKFYVLGLSPNAARLSVRFWHVDTVAGLAANICRYFEDLRIAHGERDREDLSLWRLLVSTASQGESKNIPPCLAGEMMRSILAGLPFPATLLQATLVRVKAERDVPYPRAKLIKGYLNRKIRKINSGNERSLTMSLDKENNNIGYRLGRLFSVLEKIQQEANPGINATIRDKFYSSASSAPSTVFGNLMRLKNHHLSKLENPGRRIYFENVLGEIISGIPVCFPPHLNLDDQGRFAIGYYHQAQDFWTKKAKKEIGAGLENNA